MPSTTIIWVIAGALLCLTELFLPTAFVAMTLGISALVVALLSGVLGVWLQVFVWVLLSSALVVISRRFVKLPHRSKLKIRDATTGETLTEIPAGKTGRVLYEGNSWRARCEDDITIAAHERVYITRREGTTLIILPEEGI
ncbi:MAG: NfeD family protein [Rhizonema sp. NSF051]|nr:NfeD family protein [Rhizonema sp. NSF051]